MFELSVETEFCAAHSLRFRGGAEIEPVHGHNWKVTVTVGGETLDDDGLLVDFHALEQQVGEVIGPFRNNDLNKVPPFDVLNPSAEHVARYIFAELESRVAEAAGKGGAMPPRFRVISVRVTEAPGCAVVYRGRGIRGEPRAGSVR